MIKKLLATTAVLALVAAASANISAYLGAPVAMNLPQSGTAVEVYDIHVVVDAGDDWTVGGLTCTTTTDFYQDPMNDTNTPNPAFFGMVPDSEYTSYYTTPEFIPNTANGGSVSFAFGPADGPGMLRADWFDTVDTGGGDFVVARMTVLAGGALDGTFQYASVQNSTLQTLIIPEPASLALLVLGGLVVARRR